MPRSPEQTPPALDLRGLPGARTSCALLTILTLLFAWPDPPATFEVLGRPAYFALLTWFFWRTSRASAALHTSPMRLVRSGFLVLFLGFALAAVIYFADLERVSAAFVYLRVAVESGAWFLLGTTLISYGMMLWIPHVVRSHHLLVEHSTRQQGELQRAESARSELEQRLVEADRLGMLGELAASIAHDLRNPLTVVKGTAESLCRRPRTQEEVAQHTEVIRRNIEKADHTIESLIDLARPKSGTPVDTPADALLRDTQELLQVEARRRGVRVDVLPPDWPPPLVRADHTLVAQALMNLVLNALQASPSGGAVELLTRRFGAHVALAVRDRGTGLPQEVRSNLFTPFFTTKPNGTGLGLASCRRIAKELGGDLRLYPRHRGGTRALLWLPAAAKQCTEALVGADGA